MSRSAPGSAPTLPGEEIPRLAAQALRERSRSRPLPSARVEARRAGKGGPAAVDFLLHLEPAVALPRTEVGHGGFAEASECRKPALFPLGVPARGLTVDVDTQEHNETPDALPGFPALDSAAPVAIIGGAVSVPAAKIVRFALLAWFCHPYARSTLRLIFPGKAPEFEDVEGARMKAKGAEVVVGFDDDGQPSSAADVLTALGKQLASVPEGATFELDLARKNGGPLGTHRYKAVAELGAWRVTAASPVADPRQLTEALALMEALESGRRVMARDDDRGRPHRGARGEEPRRLLRDEHAPAHGCRDRPQAALPCALRPRRRPRRRRRHHRGGGSAPHCRLRHRADETWPTRSATCSPAVAPPLSPSRAGSCPASST